MASWEYRSSIVCALSDRSTLGKVFYYSFTSCPGHYQKLLCLFFSDTTDTMLLLCSSPEAASTQEVICLFPSHGFVTGCWLVVDRLSGSCCLGNTCVFTPLMCQATISFALDIVDWHGIWWSVQDWERFNSPGLRLLSCQFDCSYFHRLPFPQKSMGN